MKLNIGAGGRRIAGYTGVDMVERPGADIVAPANAIPLADGVASEVLAVHLIEHLVPWEVADTLKEWRRLLRPGGRLVLELPDLIKCCHNIIPDQLGMWGAFGDPRQKDTLMLHRWGYTFKSLQPIVAAAEFGDIVERPTQWHPAGRDLRDFRLEAVKD
jgi:predicted SAM-dependent methyltransferase